jgi:hypothetical protein
MNQVEHSCISGIHLYQFPKAANQCQPRVRVNDTGRGNIDLRTSGPEPLSNPIATEVIADLVPQNLVRPGLKSGIRIKLLELVQYGQTCIMRNVLGICLSYSSFRNQGESCTKMGHHLCFGVLIAV